MNTKYPRDAEWFELEGRTIKSTRLVDDALYLECEDDTKWKLEHKQSCCEHVTFKDTQGDPLNLIGQKIIKAHTDRGCKSNSWWDASYSQSSTWEEFTLETRGVKVTWRSAGESNGYYCETMGFYQLGVEE